MKNKPNLYLEDTQANVAEPLTESGLTLIESDERFRVLAECISQIVWIADPEGQLTYINSRWFDYSGQTLEQAKKWGWQDILHPDDLHPYLACIRQAINEQQKYEMEVRYKNISDGIYRWHLSRGAPIKDVQGNIIKWVGTSTNIDEQKRAEEEVRRLYQEVEQRVKERTAQLEFAIQELESFSYSVSHDLRAPLRHIVSFMGLLKTHIAPALDEKATRYITTITESAKRMQQLVDNLLEFSRMGREDVQKQRVDLNDVVVRTLQEFTDECAHRQIQWHIERLPQVYADAAMLNQVLTNLIGNAIKFTRNRALTEITIGSLPNDTAEAIVYIKDNGVGFDMKYAHKLFGVFQRLHTQKEFEGTGIGLANAQRIIYRHGGRIWVESELDKGATFYFALTEAKVENQEGS